MRKKVYTIEWSSAAAKQYEKIRDEKLAGKIIEIIESELALNPLIGKPLSSPFRGVRSYRVGILRILYKVIKERVVIIILRIDHRKKAYRRPL